MSTTCNAAGTSPPSLAELASRIAAIEQQLSRIAQALVGAQAKSSSDPDAIAQLQLQALRASQAMLATAAAASSRSVTGEDTKAARVMTPLALLSDSSDQLTLIAGINAAVACLLVEAGIHRFADIAALTPEDVSELGRMLGDRRRVAREGWIEQAAMLSAGRETAHAARVRTGDLGCLAPSPAPVGTPAPATVVAAVALADFAARRAAERRVQATPRRTRPARIAGVAICAVLAGLSLVPSRLDDAPQLNGRHLAVEAGPDTSARRI